MIMKLRLISILSLVLVIFFSSEPVWAKTAEVEKVEDATEVLEAITLIPEEGIPPALLRQAYAIAVIPSEVKLGFTVGGRYGKGIMMGRDDKGEWGLPFFVNLIGGSLGWQIGIQSPDVILVFKTGKGLHAIKNGKFTLGADGSIAAGPVGRHLEAATDIQLKSEIYSYSRNRGLFAGVSFEGSLLQADKETTEILYGRPAETITKENTVLPKAVKDFTAIIESIAF